jgi:hypothetical protein
MTELSLLLGIHSEEDGSSVTILTSILEVDGSNLGRNGNYTY